MLNTSRRRVNNNSLTWWHVLKTSWRYLSKTSLRFLEDVLKTSSECIEDFLKMFWRRFYKTSWRGLGKASWRSLEDVLKTSSKRLEDVLKTSWRRMAKTNILFLTETSWRRLKDVFLRRRRKTSSRGLHQDKCLLVYYPLEKNISILSANCRLTSWISQDYYYWYSHPET